jgi:septal ring factor EnvC (AmiA/AmiB activator)
MPMPYLEPRIGSGRVIHLDTIAEILDKLVPAFNTLQREFDALQPLLQPAPADVPDARLLAVDKRREIAERQLAAAQQEVAMLAGTVRDLRAQLADVNATAGRLAYTIADMERDVAQRAEQAEAQKAEHRRKWEAIPWDAIDAVIGKEAYNPNRVAIMQWFVKYAPAMQQD